MFYTYMIDMNSLTHRYLILANKTNTNIEIVMEVKEKMKKWLAIVLGIIIVCIVIRALIIWVL